MKLMVLLFIIVQNDGGENFGKLLTLRFGGENFWQIAMIKTHHLATLNLKPESFVLTSHAALK